MGKNTQKSLLRHTEEQLSNSVTDINSLRERLAEAEEILQAIAHHAVDAFVIQGPDGEQIYTLRGAEHAYRMIMETINEGAASLGKDGTIYYCNRALATLLRTPHSRVMGAALADFIAPEDLGVYTALIDQGFAEPCKGEVRLQAADGVCVPVVLSCSPLQLDEMLGLCLVATDVSEQKYQAELILEAHERLQQEMVEHRQTEAELAEVRQRLARSQEAERLRLAQELHDVPLQELTGISLRLSLLAQIAPQPEIVEQIAALQQSVKGVARHLRILTQDLRPPVLSHLGLSAAMRSHARQVQDQRPRPAITLSLIEDRRRLSSDVKLVLFRIYQQAVQNACQHAQAREIRVRLWEEQEHLCLEVRDDGQGFVVPAHWVELARQGHLGLVGMMERIQSIGGKLEVSSTLGQGTRVRARVPFASLNGGEPGPG